MTVAGARRFQGIHPQSLYIKDQPSWPIYVSNCIYEAYDLSITCIGSAELNALPTDCCRISSLAPYYVLLSYPRSLDSWRRFPNRRAAAVFNGRTTVSKTVA